ncbi:hypothetical protein pb186bvf_003888 [Paramecium bursaria]
MIIRFRFCLLVQNLERYHFLSKQQHLNEDYKKQYQEVRTNYFRQIYEMSPSYRQQILMENILQDLKDTKDTQLLARQIYLGQLAINDNNIYEIFKNNSCIDALREYELRQYKPRIVSFELLFKHIIFCEKIELKESPLNTFNVLLYNLENNEDDFLYELVHFLRSFRTQYSILPNEIWNAIIKRIQPDQDISLLCQFMQQLAHLKVQTQLDYPYFVEQLFNRILKNYNQELFLELLRTINILEAHKIRLGDLSQLEKYCQQPHIQKQLEGELEYAKFMRIEVIKPLELDRVGESRGLQQNLNPTLIKNIHDLRQLLVEIIESQPDNNTLTKVLVLSAQYYPSEIQTILKIGRLIKNRLESKDCLSLAVNALYQFKIVQYPMIDKQLLNYIALIDNPFLKPQEISVLLYYIALSLPKISKKQFLGVNFPPQDVNKDIVQILQNITNLIQRYCNKAKLRLKVIYTLVDCYAKYHQHLNLDLNYFFEKVENNFAREMELKFQTGQSIPTKDIIFLRQRFMYMKVGSRKLMRFLDIARTDFKKAAKIYLSRERVYRKMQNSRAKALQAAGSF